MIIDEIKQRIQALTMLLDVVTKVFFHAPKSFESFVHCFVSALMQLIH